MCGPPTLPASPRFRTAGARNTTCVGHPPCLQARGLENEYDRWGHTQIGPFYCMLALHRSAAIGQHLLWTPVEGRVPLSGGLLEVTSQCPPDNRLPAANRPATLPLSPRLLAENQLKTRPNLTMHPVTPNTCIHFAVIVSQAVGGERSAEDAAGACGAGRAGGSGRLCQEG